MNKLLISPSPHVHSGDSIEKNMYGVLIALIPAFICSVLFFGMGAIIVTLTSVVACLFFEYVIQKFLLKQQPTIFDGSALITGVLPVSYTHLDVYKRQAISLCPRSDC